MGPSLLYQPGAPLQIGILIYDEVEELDFVGPFEVFKSAAAFEAETRHTDQLAWHVFTVAEHERLVTTSGGLQVQPHYTFATCPSIDLLLVPGGNASKQVHNPVTLDWLKAVTAHSRLTASVCTGAFLLGAIGLLDGHQVTTHWGALDRLAERFPQATVQRDVRWVDEGTVITAAGVSAGIDMSLHLVDRLLGQTLAEQVAHYMEYHWDRQGQAGQAAVTA
jgi:transcriptional regulator GlxA family with amidase domain